MSAAARGFVELFLALVRLYYPVVAVSHRERMPALGPCVVVANHPNGLLDPLVVRVALGRPVRFLAKSTFWDQPWSRFACEAFGAMPVYRAHEADTSRNEATFARCRDLLRGGGWLSLFPEGKSHDATELLPLKTGAARIALGARGEGAAGIRVVPVGLLYEDKAIFRSRVGVIVGEPIPVDDLAAAEPREAVDELTRRIAAGLGGVMLQADNEELWRGILAVAAWTAADGGADSAARDRRAVALAAEARRLATEDPERLEEAVAATRRFVRVMRTLGVSDPLAVVGGAAPVVGALAGLVPLLLLAPFAAIGAGMAWLPYRAVRPLAIRLARGHEDLVGTIKLLLGLVLLTATWIGWIGVGAWVAGLGGALLALVVGPVCGLAALRFDERLTLRREALRGWIRAADPRVAEAVARRRAELCRVVEAALSAS